MLHHVQRDERAGAAQARETVHGEGALAGLSDAEELVDDAVRGRGAVGEEEVVVVEALLHERAPVVLLVVEPDHGPDPLGAEHVTVVGRQQRVAPEPDGLALAGRALECKELAAHYLVHVPVGRVVVVEVLVLVKLRRHVQPVPHRLQQPRPAVGHVQVVRARHPRGIAVREARAVVDLGEWRPSFLWGCAEVKAHESAQKVDRVGHVGLRCAGVQDELAAGKAWTEQQLAHHFAEVVRHPQVERPKVCTERSILHDLVHREVVHPWLLPRFKANRLEVQSLFKDWENGAKI
mmetsp:Transcript_25575/g.52081  ORF Transcript_25575/g.52081 Transcript_25575/m.52081 type:complete len:292 (-) Transcript_25575:328-1203(-)